MNKFTKKLFTFASLSILFFTGALSANAASIYLNPDKLNTNKNGLASIQVYLNTLGVSVNNAEGNIRFNNELIEIISISKTNSIFSLWVEEPTFSNVEGLIKFGGGLPNPGYTGTNGLLFTITGRIKKIGEGDFIPGDIVIRANDGLGTNISSGINPGTHIISTEGLNIETELDKQTTNDRINIQSVTHPEENKWYKQDKPIVAWNIPAGTQAIQLTTSKNSNAIPSTTFDPPIAEKNLEVTNDGVWYFRLRAKIGNSWTPIYTRTIKIDNAPPTIKDSRVSYNQATGIITIQTKAEDPLSGVDKYEIKINNKLISVITKDDFSNNQYSFRGGEAGENIVSVKIFDRAGNYAIIYGNFTAPTSGAPIFEDFPSMISANEQIVIKGWSNSEGDKIIIYFQKAFEEPILLNTKAGNKGYFILLGPQLKPGKYAVWAESISDQGIKSTSTERKIITVTQQLLMKIGSVTLSALSIITPILGLALLLLILSYSGWRKLINLKKKVRKASTITETDIHKVFMVFKKMVEEHIKSIDKAKDKRALTSEEERFRKEFDKTLKETERYLDKDISQITNK